MAAEKDENLADLIRSQTGMGWDLMLADMHEISTEELIEGLTALELYVNKKFAQEIAGRKDAVFHLRKLIQDGRYWYQTGPGKAWSPIHAIYILALIKSKEALQLLLDTIRYRGEDLSDWLTENVTSLLVAFGEDAIEPLKEFTKDETLECFARSTATTALGVLAKKFPQHEKDVKRHLIELINSTDDGTFAALVADDLASFHDPSVMPEIHRAFEEGRIDDPFTNEDEIEAIIDGVYSELDANEFRRHTQDPLNHFSRANIEYLHTLHYAKSKPEEIKPAKKKVGKNDPCPCGSGKKYKKCCMGKGKS